MFILKIIKIKKKNQYINIEYISIYSRRESYRISFREEGAVDLRELELREIPSWAVRQKSIVEFFYFFDINLTKIQNNYLDQVSNDFLVSNLRKLKKLA